MNLTTDQFLGCNLIFAAIGFFGGLAIGWIIGRHGKA